ncbi:MAG: PAS domain-containing protein [Chthoniobacterales bacterium]|nr:PAS domain-containing protein [Chthoniobacterales bacterium]
MHLLAAGFGNDITINVFASIIASGILLGAGFLFGKYKERRQFGKRLEEYDFYPYAINRDNFPEFSLKDFRLGIHYFLRNFDARAARHLIFIGEQNNVRAQLEPPEQKAYSRLFAKYEGKKVADDTLEYLENFQRIVRLVGKSFPDLGIEILLHDLSNPSRSLTALENNVTGRRLHDGTTNLVIDLKKRVAANEDKLNYELNLGARKFKCTTIPIMRPEYGVVGAICINVDANYLTEEVLSDAAKMTSFIQTFCRTDMKLEENILSRDEYALAQQGKRHFRDTQAR